MDCGSKNQSPPGGTEEPPCPQTTCAVGGQVPIAGASATTGGTSVSALPAVEQFTAVVLNLVPVGTKFDLCRATAVHFYLGLNLVALVP